MPPLIDASNMPQTLTIGSRITSRDWKLLSLYPIAWAGHVAVAIMILNGAWLSTDRESSLALAWCAFIVAVIPWALVAMSRTQTIEVTGQTVTLSGTGIPFRPKRKVSRSTIMELNLISCCWGAYDLLVLKWGCLPWQSVYFAPLACTEDKKAIGKEVAAFLIDNRIEFTSSLETGSPVRPS